MTLAFARYETRRRIRGAVALAVGLSLLAAMVIWVYPSFADSIDLDRLLQSYPEPIVKAMGIRTMSTLAGFLAVELYNFAWVILLGLYFAYSAASLVADDVERERMDVLLSLPVSRSRIVAEKFLSLLAPILVLNVVTAAVVYVGSLLVDDALTVADLVAVHALSIPYLLACAGIGLVASVAFDREAIAQRVALAVVFALFLVESVLTDTDYEVLGAVAPMRYYDPTAVLVDGQYDLLGAAVLLAATVALVVVSQQWFRRKDLN
ncbi:ABC transporter permease [halophilic archaeon]|nr:ABC transporter permease [halophilic archaeon]